MILKTQVAILFFSNSKITEQSQELFKSQIKESIKTLSMYNLELGTNIKDFQKQVPAKLIILEVKLIEFFLS